jgi:hypothetical protein
MVNFPEILSDILSCFIPGSKSMLIVSGSLPFVKVSFSVGQLNGGSILRLTVVGSVPPFAIANYFVIGIEATPFSQVYLNSRFGLLKVK